MVTLLALFACSGPSDSEKVSDSARGSLDSADTSDDTGDSGDSAEVAADEDGDGYPSEEDCDDADATVHPGAVDACDGVDRDCDGAVVEEGGCGEVTELADTFPVAFQRDYVYAGVDCVWTPTGGDVIVDHTGFVESGRGGFAAYRWTGDTFEYALSLTEGAYEVYEHCTVVGDIDGDGTEDLALHGGSGEPEPTNEIALISGDESRWPAGLTHIDDAAFARWEGVANGDRFSEELAAGDIDGDGLVDIVTHAPLDWGPEDGGKSGWLFVLRGRADGFPLGGDVGEMADEWRYPHSRDNVERTPVDEAFRVQVVHPDLDADGLADLVGLGPNLSYLVIPGSNLTTLQGAYIEDLVETRSAETGSWFQFVAGGCADLDFDGDGVADCLGQILGDPVEDDGAVAIVSGADIADGADPLDAALTLVTPGDWTNPHPLRDLDGDGLADVALTHPYEEGTQCVLATSRLPLGGTLDAEDIAPCWHHDDGTAYIIDIMAGDFDGSGVPDLVLPQRPYESGASIPMYFLRDLALPWDDPTRW
jgi:hypothetical protein